MKLSKLACAAAAVMALSFSSVAYTAPNFYVNTDVMASGDANINGTDTDLKTSSFGVNVGNEYMTIGYMHTEYNFSGSFDPFDSLNKFTVDLRTERALSTSLVGYAGVTLGTLFEDDISLGDSYSISPRLALGWTFMNGMTAYVGAYANLNAAENVFLPIVGLKIGEDSDRGWSGSIAYPATKVNYRFNKSWSADLTYLTINDTYYMGDDVARKGLLSEGFMREKSQGASIGVTWNTPLGLVLSGGLFSYFDREFKLYDKDGNDFATFETDNCAGAYLRGSLYF